MPASDGQADDLEQLAHALPAAVAVRASPWTRSGSPTMRADAVPRVQRRERVLEDHLHLPAQRAQRRRR